MTNWVLLFYAARFTKKKPHTTKQKKQKKPKKQMPQNCVLTTLYLIFFHARSERIFFGIIKQFILEMKNPLLLVIGMYFRIGIHFTCISQERKRERKRERKKLENKN